MSFNKATPHFFSAGVTPPNAAGDSAAVDARCLNGWRRADESPTVDRIGSDRKRNCCTNNTLFLSCYCHVVIIISTRARRDDVYEIKKHRARVRCANSANVNTCEEKSKLHKATPSYSYLGPTYVTSLTASSLVSFSPTPVPLAVFLSKVDPVSARSFANSDVLSSRTFVPSSKISIEFVLYPPYSGPLGSRSSNVSVVPRR